MNALFRTLLLAALALLSSMATAHEISMAELQVRETQPGQFLWNWTAASRGGTDELRVGWPDNCREDASVVGVGRHNLGANLFWYLTDPSGNWLEFKHYSNPEAVLGCREQASVGDPELRRGP